MIIGIFDSGLGGEIVAERLAQYFPDAQFRVVNDRTHLPYGNKTSDEIYQLTSDAIQPLLGTCDVLVLACNTATAAAIDRLRVEFTDQKFVGYEPMVKPAVEISKSGQIVLLATAATVASSRYKNLVERYAGHTTIHTPATTTWATQIEARTGADINLSETRQAVDAGADVIVLACTHYLAIEQMLRDMFPGVTVIEPTRAVADRISTVVSQPQR